MFPKLIQIGSFYIPTYGVLVALGFLAGMGITLRLARRAGLPQDKITNLAVYCALSGILGAKLLMVLFDIGDYVKNPGQIFTLQTLQAAGVFHGGFVAAFVFAVLYIRRQHLPAFPTMDAFAPGVALGQAIGSCARRYRHEKRVGRGEPLNDLPDIIRIGIESEGL